MRNTILPRINRLAFAAIIAILSFSFFLLIATRHSKLSGSEKRVRIVFYNVENLFDTIDNPYKKDDEFLPTGKKKWNTSRYYEKLDNIAKVILACGEGKAPDIVGLCEVENRRVLKDLVNRPALKTAGYKIAHFDSPDMRGIDVALLYRNTDNGFSTNDNGRPIKRRFPL